MKKRLTLNCRQIPPPVWSVPPENLADYHHQIHFWMTDVNNYDTTDLANLQMLLSEEEQQRAVRFRFEKDRKRHIITHGWKRQILAQYLLTPPQKLQFDKTKREKPFLTFPKSELLFNISHSGDKIAMGVWNRKINEDFAFSLGIDIEQFDQKVEHELIAKHFFSDLEQKVIQKGGAIPVFYLFWTRKEALLKASGIGLLGNIQELEVAQNFWQQEIKNPDWEVFANQTFEVLSFPIGNDFMGSIAIGYKDSLQDFEIPEILFLKIKK